MKKVITFIAQGFGLGYSPVAPGTVGSLLGCLLVWGLTVLNFNIYVNIAICIVLTLICIPICDVAEKYIGKTDFFAEFHQLRKHIAVVKNLYT